MRLFPWWERALLRLLPGHCPLCLGVPLHGVPWCTACFAALPRNRAACLGCAEPLPGGARGLRCSRCLSAPPLMSSSKAPLVFCDEIAWLVRRFKFEGDFRAGRLLVELALAVLTESDERDWGTRFDVLLAVPSDAVRVRERGFDHADWLARRFARRVGMPLLRARRLRATGSQRGLGRRARQRNLTEVFSLATSPPPRVLLFDDVMTTGATFEALAQCCFDAGCIEVAALALARTPRSLPTRR